MRELDILLEQSDLIVKTIMELENKSYFVKAYLKFVNSSDYKLYKILKQQQLISDEKAITDRINYLEQYGPVSDVLYLKESCEDVKKYIKLIKLNTRINNEIKFINNSVNNCNKLIRYY